MSLTPLLAGLLLLLSAVSAPTTTAQIKTFTCSTAGATCQSLIDYVSPNATTLKSIQTLFGVKNLRSILGANNLSLSTPRASPVSAKQTIKIPFPCKCSNGTGVSNGRPIYTVQPDDGLYHIATDVFAGLVTYPQIAVVNNITDANQIEVGQKLWIPLPCSCDKMDGVDVVHYGHVVESGNSVEAMAEKYGTTPDRLLSLNGMANASDLLAGQVFDIPLRACSSKIVNGSLDYSLLVANGTYAMTANNCVKCKCDGATNNWTLQCEPSRANASTWESCPSMICDGGNNLSLGNKTTSGCNTTTCQYTGFTNQTVLTTLVTESTCPVQNNHGSKMGMQAWSWNFLLIGIHLGLLCAHLL